MHKPHLYIKQPAKTIVFAGCFYFSLVGGRFSAACRFGKHTVLTTCCAAIPSYSRDLYNCAISSTLVSLGLPGRQASS